MIKIISLLLFVSPVLNLLLIYILKSIYKGYVLKIVHFAILLASIAFLLMKTDSALMLFTCNLLSLLLLFLFEKIYYSMIDQVLGIFVSQIAEADVISSVFMTSKSVFALTTEGYVAIDLRTIKYKLNKDIQEFSRSEQMILNKLKARPQKNSVRH